MMIMMILIGQTLTAKRWNDRKLQDDRDESETKYIPQSLSVTFPLLDQ